MKHATLLLVASAAFFAGSRLDEHEKRIETLEAVVVDHAERIRALEVDGPAPEQEKHRLVQSSREAINSLNEIDRNYAQALDEIDKLEKLAGQPRALDPYRKVLRDAKAPLDAAARPVRRLARRMMAGYVPTAAEQRQFKRDAEEFAKEADIYKRRMDHLAKVWQEAMTK
jgi:hypothetical protein